MFCFVNSFTHVSIMQIASSGQLTPVASYGSFVKAQSVARSIKVKSLRPDCDISIHTQPKYLSHEQ